MGDESWACSPRATTKISSGPTPLWPMPSPRASSTKASSAQLAAASALGALPKWIFSFPEFPDLKTYFQQRELDPGRYEVSTKNGGFSWTNRATLSLSRTKRKVEIEITKSLTPALNPLRCDREPENSTVKYAGYTLHGTLQVRSTEPVPPVGMWHLTQLPHGGDMLVPTFFRSQPKIYMGTISPDDLIVDNHLVRYRMRSAGEHKLGVRAAAATGRAGYMYTVGNETSLVVRNFNVNPSGEYIDVPWAETQNFGIAFQACNVNSGLGAFSELEYHVPAVGPPEGSSRSDDQSQLWAFRDGRRPFDRLRDACSEQKLNKGPHLHRSQPCGCRVRQRS